MGPFSSFNHEIWIERLKPSMRHLGGQNNFLSRKKEIPALLLLHPPAYTFECFIPL